MNEILLSTEELLTRAREATSHLLFNGRIDADLTERTLRYYLSMKYLSPSLHRGGRRAWTERHLTELIGIREALSAGRSLKDIDTRKSNGTESSWRGSNQGARRLSGSMAAAARVSDAHFSPTAQIVANEAPLHSPVPASAGWTVALAHNVFLSGFTPDKPNQPEIEAIATVLSRILHTDDNKKESK